jgi:pimeloyl-ACP methyl ester carboxylesterase
LKTSSISCLGKPVTLYEYGTVSHPTLFLIHGNSVHSGFFLPLIRLLEDKYYIITLDLPGHNLSGAWEKNDLNRENLAFLFNSVLDHFLIREVTAFGFSMGGFMLLETFDLVPAIRKIAIAGHPPLHSMENMPEAYYLNEDSALFLQGSLSENEIERLYNAVIRIKDSRLKSEIIESIRNTSPAFREGCLNLAQHTGDQVDRLNQFRKPIAVIHAADDLAVRLEYLEKLELRNFWEQKIQVITGCGHYIIGEKPGELATLLERFLSFS